MKSAFGMDHQRQPLVAQRCLQSFRTTESYLLQVLQEQDPLHHVNLMHKRLGNQVAHQLHQGYQTNQTLDRLPSLDAHLVYQLC